MRDGSRMVGVAVMLMCLAAFLGTAFVLNREHGFWSPDSALRFVMVESLVRNGGVDIDVPYPAAALDREGRFFPADAWFHFERGGRHYLSYLPYFPAVSALWYRPFGHFGLLVVPLAGGLTVVGITYGVLRRLVAGLAAWGALAVGLCTPLLLYSAVFWDHSVAAALAAGAMAPAAVALARGEGSGHRPAVLAGALLGLGLWLRNEMYLLAFAIGLAWLLTAPPGHRARVVSLAVSAAVVALPAWVINARLYGSPLGWKGHGLVVGRARAAAAAAGGPRATQWIAERIDNVYHMFLALDFTTIWRGLDGLLPQAAATGVLVGAMLLGAGWLLRSGAARESERRMVAAVLMAAAAVALSLSGRTPLAGLLPALPLVVLAMLGGPVQRWEWFLWIAIATYTGAVMLTGTHAGLQWGPRYLLPVVPALVWLAAAAVRRARDAAPRVWPALRVAAGVFAGLSLLVQAAGVDHVALVTANNVRAQQVLRSAPSDVVASAIGYLIMGAGQVYFEKRLMLVEDVDELRGLVRTLADQRVSEWTYIPSSGPAFDPRLVAEWTARGPWRYVPSADRLPYANLRVVTYRGFSGSP